MITHVYAIFICLYRELFEVRIGFIGGIMKLFEVIGVYLYLTVLIVCLSQFSFWLYELSDSTLILFSPVDNKDAMKLVLNYKPEYLKNRDIIFERSGGILVWFIIEIIVHVTYILTMIILMGKSRFFSVGIDNTPQF